MGKVSWILLLAAAAGLWGGMAVPAGAEGELVPGIAVPLENGARVRQADATNAALYKGNADVLVLPGLVADRKRQRVEVMAEATGLSSNSIVEFLLISETSEHGYEALFVSFAKPSDIHKALEFIGMKAGAPYNPQQLRMWPKGERVRVSLVSPGAGSAAAPVRIERLILDTKTGQTLPEAGFVFTGSLLVPLANGQGAEYGADAWEPKSVVSIYNEPYSVLDIPRLTRKSDVYGEQVVNPQFPMAKGALRTLALEPEYKDGRKRVRDLVLDVLPPAPGASVANAAKSVSDSITNQPDAAGPVFRLAEQDGKPLGREPRLEDVRQALKDLDGKGYDAFVSVRFDPGLRLDSARDAARIVAGLEDKEGMRSEPPGPGQLYFRAFLANEEWRKRENRAGQPWELFLARKGAGLAGKLVLVEILEESDWANPQFKTTEFAVPDAAALGRKLAEDADARKKAGKRVRMPVALVFADPAMTYGPLAEFIRPLLDLSYVVYVFLDEAPK